MKTLLIGIKNVLLWSYARGTWQYDILCILIIATVFLVPSSFFGDRDRTMHTYRASKAKIQANEAPKVASNKTTETIPWVVLIEELRAFLPEQTQTDEWMNNPQEVIVQYLNGHLDHPAVVESCCEPQRDEAQQIIGYRVRFK